MSSQLSVRSAGVYTRWTGMPLPEVYDSRDSGARRRKSASSVSSQSRSCFATASTRTSLASGVLLSVLCGLVIALPQIWLQLVDECAGRAERVAAARGDLGDGGFERGRSRAQPVQDDLLGLPPDPHRAVAAGPVLDLPVCGHPLPVGVEAIDELGHAVSGGRGGELDRHLP